MITNNDILKKAEGGTIYTWILKRDNVHILPLRSNQEIGSLHAELDLLTTVYQNMGDNRVKPDAAGELVISKDKEDKEDKEDKTEIYFNLQSGTFMAPKYDEAVKAVIGTTSGISKQKKTEIKQRFTKPFLYGNKHNYDTCEDIKEDDNSIILKLSKAIGIHCKNLHFLDCSDQIDSNLRDQIDSKLREILPNNFDHSACRDDNEYNESIAGKNLIRRYNHITNPENRRIFNTYFTTKKRKPNNNSLGPPAAMINISVVTPPSQPAKKRVILQASRATNTNPLQPTLGGRRNTTRRKRKTLRKRRI